MVVAVIGAGPAGLMAAEVLTQGGAGEVTVYDAMPSAGRKFLMAGRGGLNLTHSEPLPQFLARYREAIPHLKAAIDAFTPSALRDWSNALGQETFIGSSGRVFPKSFKASPLLRAWLRRLDSKGVQFAFRHRWIGWNDRGALKFRTPEGEHAVDARATVLALGGASWPRLGSDGGWVDILRDESIANRFGTNEGKGTGSRHHPIAGIDVVFDQHRNAVQRTAWTFLFAFAIESDRDSFGVGIHFDHRVQAGALLVDVGDAVGVFLDELARCVFARLQAVLEIGDG